MRRRKNSTLRCIRRKPKPPTKSERYWQGSTELWAEASHFGGGHSSPQRAQRTRRQGCCRIVEAAQKRARKREHQRRGVMKGKAAAKEAAEGVSACYCYISSPQRH